MGSKSFQNNVRGRNETLNLHLQFGFQRVFRIGYRFPYIDKRKRFGLGFNFGYSEQKNLNVLTVDHFQKFINSRDFDEPIEGQILRDAIGGSVSVSFRGAFYTFHGLTATFIAANIADTVAAANPNYFLNGRTSQDYFALRYNFTRDKRDFANYPLSGSLTRFELSKIGLGIMDDLDYWLTRINYSKWFDLGKGFYYGTGLSSAITFPFEQPYSRYTKLGTGNNFIRGFELNVVEGPINVIVKNGSANAYGKGVPTLKK